MNRSSPSLQGLALAVALLTAAAGSHAQPSPSPGDAGSPGSLSSTPTPPIMPPQSPTGAGTGTGTGTGPGIGYGTPTADLRTAQANTGGSVGSSGYTRSADAYSLIPWTRRGWVGIQVGDAKYKTGCGSAAFGCSNPDASLHLSTGGLLNDWVGLEVGYLYTGEASRGGGTTSAQGLNLSVVLRAPLGAFNAFIKGGGIYAQTKVSVDPASGLASGRRTGWGGVYGAGLGFDFTPNQGVVLEWSRAELQFPGAGKQNFDSTSLGYVYRF